MFLHPHVCYNFNTPRNTQHSLPVHCSQHAHDVKHVPISFIVCQYKSLLGLLYQCTHMTRINDAENNCQLNPVTNMSAILLNYTTLEVI